MGAGRNGLRPLKMKYRKRVQIVSVKLVREASVTYAARKIKAPEDAAALIRDFIEEADREHFIAVYLNAKNEPTAIHTVSVGTLNSATVHPREVFKVAILANAAAIILAHNHPSGDPTPSRDDFAVTERLIEAGHLMGIEVIDHVVVGSEGRYTSLKEKGMI